MERPAERSRQEFVGCFVIVCAAARGAGHAVEAFGERLCQTRSKLVHKPRDPEARRARHASESLRHRTLECVLVYYASGSRGLGGESAQNPGSTSIVPPTYF